MNTKEKKSTNEIGCTYDPFAAACREFDVNEIHRFIAGSGPSRAWSWGFTNPLVIIKNKVYRFTVNGHHHRGYVYVTLGFSDTFTIHYTSNRGTIKKIAEEVYIDELINRLDEDIERIPEYVK